MNVATTVERHQSGKMKNRRIGGIDETTEPDSLIFHPWFLSHSLTYAIRRLLPPEHKFKMRDYFAEYGCLRCDEKKGYWALGLCARCYTKIHRRLRVCLRKRARVMPSDQTVLKYLEDARKARKLLKGFPRKMYVNPRSRLGGGYRINNPARAAFIVLNNYDPKLAQL